ncbi:MAG TPA: hypothetical protein VGN48_06585 [Pedococcus sp.]|nr:hypothetical protein [Pedococcus sp.]
MHEQPHSQRQYDSGAYEGERDVGTSREGIPGSAHSYVCGE